MGQLFRLISTLTPMQALFIALKAFTPIGFILALNVLFGFGLMVNIQTYLAALFFLWITRPRMVPVPIMMMAGGLGALTAPSARPRPSLSIVRDDNEPPKAS